MTTTPSLIAITSRQTAGPATRLGTARAGRLVLDQVTLSDALAALIAAAVSDH